MPAKDAGSDVCASTRATEDTGRRHEARSGGAQEWRAACSVALGNAQVAIARRS